MSACLFNHCIAHPFRPFPQWLSFSSLWHPVQDVDAHYPIIFRTMNHYFIHSAKIIQTFNSMKSVVVASQTCCAKRCAPMAIVTERTVGIAIGIPPISRTSRLSMPTRYFLFWWPYITMISITIPIAIEQRQKFPIDVKTWKHHLNLTIR